MCIDPMVHGMCIDPMVHGMCIGPMVHGMCSICCVSCLFVIVWARSFVVVGFDFKDYKEEWDPAKFKSKKTGRGELKSDWKDTSTPVMCCYKLVECEFKWFGLQGTVESRIQKVRLGFVSGSFLLVAMSN